MLSAGALFFYFYNRIKVFSGKEKYKKGGGGSPIGPIAARFEVSFGEEDVSALEESIIPFQTAFKNSNCECQ